MRTCPKCNRKIVDDDGYCDRCQGTVLDPMVIHSALRMAAKDPDTSRGRNSSQEVSATFKFNGVEIGTCEVPLPELIGHKINTDEVEIKFTAVGRFHPAAHALFTPDFFPHLVHSFRLSAELFTLLAA